LNGLPVHPLLYLLARVRTKWIQMQEVENRMQFKDCLRWQQCEGGSGEEQQVERDDENGWGFEGFEV